MFVTNGAGGLFWARTTLRSAVSVKVDGNIFSGRGEGSLRKCEFIDKVFEVEEKYRKCYATVFVGVGRAQSDGMEVARSHYRDRKL